MKTSTFYNLIGAIGISFSAANVAGVIEYNRFRKDPINHEAAKELPDSFARDMVVNSLVLGLAGCYSLLKGYHLRKEEKEKGLEQKISAEKNER
ncbi:MAG: hypothetical protein AABX05_04055 [Nanoarchaeota archaeon]